MDAITAIAPAEARNTRTPGLWAAAQALEASFLAEMLKHSGLGEPREAFGGGAGEASFSSFLTTEYARSMADSGGIGLAESIYRALATRTGDA